MVVTGDFDRALVSGDKEYTWLKREYIGQIGGYTAYKSIYLNGHCGVIALALHDMYGYDIWRIGDSDGYLHDFCYNGGHYIDIRGITSDISLMGLGIDSGNIVLGVVNDLRAYRKEIIERKLGKKVYNDSQAIAKKLIKLNRDWYNLQEAYTF